MNTKQKIAVGVVAGATVLTGLYGATVAQAATTTTDLPPMIQGMAEKFGLNKAEVQSYVQESRAANRTERQAEREKVLTEKLSQAVSGGKITEAQKSTIWAKHEEIQAKRADFMNLSREEKRVKMQELRTEMQNYLKSQGIDETVMPAPQGPRGGGMGGGLHRGQQ